MNINDNITHPKHYEINGYNPIVLRERLPANIADAFKYLWRRKHKGQEKSDLSKALWYINRAIKLDTLEALSHCKLNAEINYYYALFSEYDNLTDHILESMTLMSLDDKRACIDRLYSLCDDIVNDLYKLGMTNKEIEEITKGL